MLSRLYYLIERGINSKCRGLNCKRTKIIDLAPFKLRCSLVFYVSINEDVLFFMSYIVRSGS